MEHHIPQKAKIKTNKWKGEKKRDLDLPKKKVVGSRIKNFFIRIICEKLLASIFPIECKCRKTYINAHTCGNVGKNPYPYQIYKYIFYYVFAMGKIIHFYTNFFFVLFLV